MWMAGGNNHTIRNNFFYDNWRRATMIFSIPDALVCGPAADNNQQHGCDQNSVSTSHYNQTYDNTLNQRPDGTVDPNGQDVWWDNFSGARGNCWFRNKSALGALRNAPVTLPDCKDGTASSLSLGTGAPPQEQELLACAGAFETRNFDQPNPCAWLNPPADPGDGKGGGSAPAGPTLTSFPAARASGVPRQRDVPLGQTSCRDWNAAQSDASRLGIIAKVRGFVGGRINDATTEIGHGPRMSDSQTSTLFDNWCGYRYADGFLLYKLYAFTGDLHNAFSGKSP